jgi:hypothetical protein
MSKLELSSLIGCCVSISKTIGVVWISVGYPTFNAFLIIVLWGKIYLYVNKE